MNEKHQAYVKLLETRTYDSLFVRRHGKWCWFCIRANGEDYVYLNELGKSPEYHHVWQIRKWLHEKFGIPPEEIKVVVDRVE